MQHSGKAQKTWGGAPKQSAVRFVSLTALRSQIACGMDPVKSLSSKAAILNILSLPNDSGMDPLNLLLEKSATSKLGILAQLVVSIGPERPLSDTSRNFNSVSFDKLGSGPSKLLSFAVNTSVKLKQCVT